MSQPTTPAHEQTDTLHEDILYPEHLQRTESAEFRENKHHLVHDLGLGCWICGSREHLEIHHALVEWSLYASVDPAKVLETAKAFDPYGFTAADPDSPISSPDDARNLLVLCAKHHRHPYFGVHTISMPIWISQRSAKDGVQITQDPAQEKGAS